MLWAVCNVLSVLRCVPCAGLGFLVRFYYLPVLPLAGVTGTAKPRDSIGGLQRIGFRGGHRMGWLGWAGLGWAGWAGLGWLAGVTGAAKQRAGIFRALRPRPAGCGPQPMRTLKVRTKHCGFP